MPKKIITTILIVFGGILMIIGIVKEAISQAKDEETDMRTPLTYGAIGLTILMIGAVI